MRLIYISLVSCGLLYQGQLLASETYLEGILQSAKTTIKSVNISGKKLYEQKIEDFNETTTFEAFYKQKTEIGWIVVGVTAVASGVAIYLTGGAASPGVVPLATWIGTTMGYSGIAATNTGLALLGGGSIASGGFGIAGGAAIASSVVAIGTGAVADKAINNSIDSYKYNYQSFTSTSQNLMTLPLPINDTGPHSYQVTLGILEKDIDSEKPLSGQYNQKVIKRAIATLRTTKEDKKSSTKDIAKAKTLLAILYFVSNDYRQAKKASRDAYELGTRIDKSEGTLPAFIYGTCLLYEEGASFNFSEALKYFEWSVNGEKGNPLKPYMFAIFVDRMEYRLRDGAITIENLEKVYNLTSRLEHNPQKAVIQVTVNDRSLNSIEYLAKHIRSLTTSDNRTIKNDKGTLEQVKLLMPSLERLIQSQQRVFDTQFKALQVSKNRDPNTVERLAGSINDNWGAEPKWESDWEVKLNLQQARLNNLQEAITPLKKSISDLEEYQSCWFFCG